MSPLLIDLIVGLERPVRWFIYALAASHLALAAARLLEAFGRAVW